MKQRKCGFTLVELLVVIAIIAMLVTLVIACCAGGSRSSSQYAMSKPGSANGVGLAES